MKNKNIIYLILIIVLGLLIYLFINNKNSNKVLTVNINSDLVLKENKVSCELNNNNSCIVELPIQDNEFIVYKDNNNIYEQGYKLEINKDIELQAYEENKINLVLTIEDKKLECITTNRKHNCDIKIPDDVNNTYTDGNNIYKSGDIINIKEDTILKIKKDELLLTIYSNGANKVNNVSCKINVNNKCKVKLPDVKRNDGEVLGYNLINSKEVEYKINEELELTKDTKIYVISKKTLSLKIKNDKLTCDIYNEEKNCNVIIPKNKYEDIEIYINNVKYKSGSTVLLTKDEEAVIKEISNNNANNNTNNNTNDNTNNNSNKYINPNLVITFDPTCPNLDVRKSNMEQVKKLAPYILHSTKSISFLSESNFYKEQTNDTSHSGGVVGFQRSHQVFIKCTREVNKNEARYQTLIHEIMHSAVHAIYQATGKSHSKIAQDIGASAIFNKYSDCPDTLLSERPLTSYSYDSIDEFLCDGYSYYYLGYIDPTGKYASNRKITGDTLKAFQRLDCIFKDSINNYANYNFCLTKF